MLICYNEKVLGKNKSLNSGFSAKMQKGDYSHVLTYGTTGNYQ